ncbi:TrkH family potassium uptake protein, partial [Candidatus Woesearchaeota archaeon]|nr:TrkH family potassium uptake protein [Candidatus Woesearchaeota archaeon]
AGMDFFESIAMAFTSISTGGFTVSDSFYSNNWQLLVLCILMLLGSISFIIHNKLLQKKFREFITSFEKNIFFAFLLLAVILALFVFRDARVVLFELVSAFTTTGYSITNISLLPHLFIMVIMLGMIMGGGIASTAGGMKVSRVYSILKSIPWMLKKLASPAHTVIPFRISNQTMEEKDLVMVYVFAFSFIFIIVIGTIIFMFFGYNFLDSSFQVTSALGTVGLQTMELAALNWLCKAVLILAMLLGRLEIFPLLILVRGIFRR